MVLDYSEFFAKYGGSARTKNLHREADPAAGIRASGNKRHMKLPPPGALPAEFIRLCPWEMEYLFTVARRARLGILETGRFNGGSLFVMTCAAKPGVPIYSIDLKPQNDALLLELLSAAVPDANPELIVGDSQHVRYPQIGAVDLLFIDGDHSYEGCMADIANWYGNLAVNGHLLFHDAYLGRHGVQDAIADFMNGHPELQVIHSPFIGRNYWNYAVGSIAHLIRRG
jgi:predicted O-methyltransferase YrrM